jgi:DNA-directed RNA polymerase sigma subunit (sigma70/sigma32)
MKEFKEFMFEKIAENNTDLLFFIENKLTPKQKQVIQQRFMSNKNRIMQFNELAQKFDLSIERLRQIEFEAIFKIYYNSIGIIDAFIAWQKTRDRDKEDEE